MGRIKRIGDEYVVEFAARGLTYQQKAGTDARRAACLLKETEAKIRKGEMGCLSREVTWRAVFDDVLKRSRQEDTAITHARYQAALRDFATFLAEEAPGRRFIRELTPRVLHDYVHALRRRLSRADGLPRSGERKIDLTLLLLRDLFDEALRQGYIQDNPVMHVSLTRSPCRAPQFLSVLQDERLMRAPDAVCRVFRVLMTTGLSLSELAVLRLQDVDFPAMRFRVPPFASVRGSQTPRRLDISGAEAFRDLMALQNPGEGVSSGGDGPFLPPDLAENVRSYVKRSGLPAGVTVAAARSFIDRLLKRGIPPLKLARLSGLPDVAMLLRFTSSMEVGEEAAGRET